MAVFFSTSDFDYFVECTLAPYRRATHACLTLNFKERESMPNICELLKAQGWIVIVTHNRLSKRLGRCTLSLVKERIRLRLAKHAH